MSSLIMIQLIQRVAIVAIAISVICGGAFSQVAIHGDDTRITRNFLGNLNLTIGLSEKTAYRVIHLENPQRIAVDLRNVALDGMPDLTSTAAHLSNSGRFTESWSRLIFALTRPQVLESASFQEAGAHVKLVLHFAKASDDEFASSARKSTGISQKRVQIVPAKTSGRLMVALDPGHGGIDPGATRDGIAEKDIALTFGLEVAALLQGTGRYDVFMTRSDDRFVSLSNRVFLAREVDADIFISLHANTVTKGNASGATMYVLSEKASDPEAAALAVLENKADTIAGWTQNEQNGDIVGVLKDMARNATAIRSRNAARALVSNFGSTVGVIQSRPLRSANFKVLRAHDMPSVLVELGFMTNAHDLKRMTSPAWRAQAADALLNALDTWKNSDGEKVMLTVSGQ